MALKTAAFLAVMIVITSGPGVWADPIADSDKVQQFLSDLYHSNGVEIQMGEMATGRAKSEAVKMLATLEVQDHRDGDRKIKKVAETEGLAIVSPAPTGFVAKIAASNEHGQISELAKQTGRDFDVLFAKAIVADHTRELDLLKSAQETLRDPAIQQLISELFPATERHLQMAEKIQLSS